MREAAPSDTNSQFATNVYYDRTFDCDAAKILPGEYYYTPKDMLIVTVLGSCVSACIRDRVSGPRRHEPLHAARRRRPGQPGVGLDALRDLRDGSADQRSDEGGARREHLEAKVFGGGAVLRGISAMNVGERNTEFVMRLPEDRTHPGRGRGPDGHLSAQGVLPAAHRQGDGQAPDADQRERWRKRESIRQPPEGRAGRRGRRRSIDLF